MGEMKVLRSIDEAPGLSHIGVLERSGRFPWGSGENPYQRLKDWKGYVSKLRKGGMTDEEIAKTHGMTIEEFKDSLISTSTRRQMTTIRKAEATVANVARAWELKNKGYSNVAIGEAMGVNESVVRTWLKPGADEKARHTLEVAETFKKAVDEKGVIDVGGGVENYLGVSKTRMDACLELLKEEGYNLYWAKVQQAGTGKDTTIRALCPPDMDYKTFMEKYAQDPSIVKPVGFYAEERNGDPQPIGKPTSISRDRVMVRYGEEGGLERDGTIELRPGVEDLDLLGTKYAQVRIGIDDKMYMKGMAIYGDPKDFPDGVDVIYNVNRSRGAPDLKTGAQEGIFKPMYKKGEEDAFGASTSLKSIDEETGDIIYQKTYIGSDGKQHQSALNIVNDQGSWDEWSPSLASQFLSKQPVDLAKKQLNIVQQSKQDEFDEIMALNNPTVRKKMLDEFADSCDSAAVHLKAAALPRQKTQVLIPINTLADNEIYAPNFRDGETVVLVRYPHAGPFESPELTVNNKNKLGQDIIGKVDSGGRSLDAVGINANVAKQLSGADFDGDSVLVLPNNDGAIKVKKMIADLNNFEPSVYKLSDDSPELKKSAALRERNKQTEMGVISNLITDMTIQGASEAELVRAVKHSMVVIDCVKHDLDWKESYKQNGIQELKNKYQPKEDPDKPGGGASTLISRAKSEARIPERSMVYSTSKMTEEEKAAYDRGEIVYRNTNRTIKKKTDEGWVDTGKLATQSSTKMKEAKDAKELSSGTPIEEVYAAHANALKSLANQARAASRTTPKLEQSPSAKQTYAAEVESLTSKLKVAEMNRPVERQAQLIASASLKAKVAANPELKEDKDAYKKAQTKALTLARTMTGANKSAVQVKITDSEWNAIQAGAISDSMLQRILNNTDTDAVKKRATPRATTGLSNAQISRIKSMANSGLTQAEIADALGISTSSVSNALKS